MLNKSLLGCTTVHTLYVVQYKLNCSFFYCLNGIVIRKINIKILTKNPNKINVTATSKALLRSMGPIVGHLSIQLHWAGSTLKPISLLMALGLNAVF